MSRGLIAFDSTFSKIPSSSSALAPFMGIWIPAPTWRRGQHDISVRGKTKLCRQPLAILELSPAQPLHDQLYEAQWQLRDRLGQHRLLEPAFLFGPKCLRYHTLKFNGNFRLQLDLATKSLRSTANNTSRRHRVSASRWVKIKALGLRGIAVLQT